jgi:hypothetical protein
MYGDIMEQESRLCYTAVVRKTGYGIGIVKEGESGYYATNWPDVDSYDKAVKWANDKLGLSDDEVDKMVARSMFP